MEKTPLSQEETDKILTRLQNIIHATKCGFTFYEDINGVCGDLGAKYLTLRFKGGGGDHCEVTMRITSVRNMSLDMHEDSLRRVPQ